MTTSRTNPPGPTGADSSRRPADASGAIRSGRLAGLSMSRAIWILSWPILAESLLNSTVGLVDTTLSAGLSQAAADAVGAASYITWFLALIETAVAVGATALIARAVGKGRNAVANAAVGQTVLLSVLTGLAVGAAVYAVAPGLASMLRLDDATRAEFVRYLRLCAIGTPMLSLLGAGCACARGAGDALRPLWIMVAVNVFNIVASWTLSGVDFTVSRPDGAGGVEKTIVLANPFRFEMGIAGIGLGTLIAWTIGALLVTWVLVSGKAGVRLRAARLRPHWVTLARVIRVGLPNFFETLGMWFGNFLVILLVGWMQKPGVLGAHIVAIRIEALSFLPGFAMGLSAATLVGQYMGAGRVDLARRAMWICIGAASALMGAMGLLFMFAGPQITGVFTPQPEHHALVPRLLFICGVVQVPFAVMMVVRSGIRGAGDTNMAMWLTTISTYLVRLPLAYLLSGVDIPLPGGGVIENPSPWDGGLVGLWIGLCGELVVRGVLFGWRFVQGGWERARV